MTTRPLYNRRVRIEVYDPSGRRKAWNEELRLDFDAQATASGKLGSGKLKLFNLNEDSISLIKTKRSVIRCTAGFEGATGLIHVGTITRVSVDDTGPDTIVNVESLDGYGRYSSVRVNRSWRATTAIEVARRLALDAGLVLRLPSDLDDVELPDGYLASGLWRREFDDVMTILSCDWGIVDGLLQVVRKGSALPRQAIVISEGTGLVGSPRETGRNNLTLRTLLNPAIKVRNIVRVDSRGRQTFARVLSCKHSGSSWGDDFYTDIEVKKL